MMAYHAKSLDNVTDTSYRPIELPLQVSGKSPSMPPTAHLIGISQHTTMPTTQMVNTYSTVDNSQIQSGISLALVPTLVQTQTMVSSNGAHLTKMGAPVVTSSTMGIPQMPQLILPGPKQLEEGQRDQERRIRREIANSNERRRMQSINAGFKSLKTILPHTDGEKLSKAAILQQTSEYITQLEGDKLKLLHQNEKLRRAFADCKCNSPKHRAIVCDIFDKDEGIGSPAEEDFEDMRRGIIEVRKQLDKERRMRLLLEDQVRSLQGQIYPNKIREIKQKMISGTSSDERRSSSDCSPGTNRNESDPFETKPPTCTRPLLPPLTPLLTNFNPTEGALPPSTVVEPEKQQLPQSFSSTASGSLLIPAESIYKTHCPTEPQASSNKTVLFPKNFEEKTTSTQSTSVPQPITVFSHSTNSNQPLKKRAIEVRESFAEGSSYQAAFQQPKTKMAKISIDADPPPSELGTRSFLPPSLPPITANGIHTQQPVLHTLPLPQFTCNTTTAQPQKTPVTYYPVTTSATQYPTIPSLSSPGTLSQHKTTASYSLSTPSLPPQTPKPQLLGAKVAVVGGISPQTVITPNPTLLPTVSPSTTISTGVCQTPTHIENVTPSCPSRPHNEPKQQQYTVVEGSGVQPAASTQGPTNPLYLTVGALHPQTPTNATYIQPIMGQNLECVMVTPSNLQAPHLVMAPLNIAQNSGILMHNTDPPRPSSEKSKNGPAQVTYQAMMDSRQLTTPNMGPSANTLPSMITQANSALAVQSVPFSDANTQNPTYIGCRIPSNDQTKLRSPLLQCSNLPKAPASTRQTLPQAAVLCYSSSEPTLNQLNAVPNLAPPPTRLVPPAAYSLVQQLNSSSPSYVSPALQEPVLPARISGYHTYPDVRRRKSSFSATDSCSTASVSGAEEEDPRNPLMEDPDCQSSDSIPTIKLGNSLDTHSVSSPRRRTSQHSSSDSGIATSVETSSAGSATPKRNEQTGTDVADSGNASTATRATLSVLSTVAGSPPLIRRIDAIQTRRNLETIVQAIDHLEQQERRNSQDHAVTSPPSPSARPSEGSH